MATTMIFVLCSFVVGISTRSVTFHADRPFQGVSVSETVELLCCYDGPYSEDLTWIVSYQAGNKTQTPLVVNGVKHRTTFRPIEDKGGCGVLTIISAQLSDTGMYACRMNISDDTVNSHGTYLQVYKPLEKTLNLRESTKNKILTVEGILLLLSVVLPSVNLLFKSKKLHQLEKKKAMKEEENIYQGLNLEDCCTTYDQIERSQAQGPYQDVCNVREEEEDMQLEKP